MDNIKSYLSIDVLNALYLEVAKKLPHLQDFKAEEIWNTPIDYCKRIEANVYGLQSIIVEITKDRTRYISSCNPYNYEILLTRIYILLYYRHNDKDVYKKFVFLTLHEFMGIYNTKFLNFLQSRVTKVLETEKMIEECLQKNKENIHNEYINAEKIPPDIIQEKETLKKICAEQSKKIEELRAKLLETEKQKGQDIDQLDGNGFTSEQAALFIQYVCHKIGGMPNNKKSLAPVLSSCWGFKLMTAERALGRQIKEDVADKTSKVFKDIAPKIERELKGFHEIFNEKRVMKLKNNNK